MMIMDLDCGIEPPLDLFGVVYVLWYKYYLMYSGLGSSVAERVSSKSKVPSSILGSGRYFHWKLNVTLILYIVHRGLHGQRLPPSYFCVFGVPKES